MAKRSTAKRRTPQDADEHAVREADELGAFKEIDDVGRSQNATTVKSGYGDPGTEAKCRLHRLRGRHRVLLTAGPCEYHRRRMKSVDHKIFSSEIFTRSIPPVHPADHPTFGTE